MNEEMTAEISEMCVTACEKFPEDNGVSSDLELLLILSTMWPNN